MLTSNYYLSDFSSLEFYELLTPDEKLTFISSSRIVSDKQLGEKVFNRGDVCNSIFFVLEGSIKLSFHQSEEKEHISTIAHKGMIFGECCLFGKSNHQFDAAPIEDKTKILIVSADTVKSLMKANFEFNMKIVHLIGLKIEKSEERLFSFAMKDARQRILAFLKENVENNGRKVGLEMLIKHGLTQQDIANFTGTSRQTVTTVLNDLKSKNEIHLRRKSILIRDVEALV